MDQDWLFQWLNLEENNSIQFPSSAMRTEGHWMVLSITMMVTIRSSKVGTTDIRAVWFSLLLGGHLVLCRVLAISWPLSSCSQFTLSQLQQLKTSSGITQCLLGAKLPPNCLKTIGVYTLRRSGLKGNPDREGIHPHHILAVWSWCLGQWAQKEV